ncbi:MAG: HipA N-terminal domain-containing protein [Bacteroidota bacterium]
MRQGTVYYNSTKAGTITETDEGEYIFQYEPKYVTQFPKQFIAFNFPVRTEPYTAKRLFSFFEGLIPEGWLLDIASKSWKIKRDDQMGLLLACCHNCIGAVSVEPIETTNE